MFDLYPDYTRLIGSVNPSPLRNPDGFDTTFGEYVDDDAEYL